MAEKMKKRIVVGATGASGLPLLVKCLEIIREDPDFESYLIMSSSAELTLRQETELEVNDVKRLADHVCAPEEIGAKPASGSFKTEGMLIVPCSMKTIAGIHSGYADNLILRAADVTIKEQRTLVLAARETPLSGIHLRNLYELSMLPGVRIISRKVLMIWYIILRRSFWSRLGLKRRSIVDGMDCDEMYGGCGMSVGGQCCIDR